MLDVLLNQGNKFEKFLDLNRHASRPLQCSDGVASGPGKFSGGPVPQAVPVGQWCNMNEARTRMS